MFVLELVLIVASLQSCDEKCTGAVGTCGGTPTCSGLSSDNCWGECTWVAASPASCSGNPTCSAQANETACGTVSDCSWTIAADDLCTGAPTTCSGNSEANCALSGCTYTSVATPPTCGNGYASCSNAITSASCGVLNNCEWSPARPPKCLMWLEEETKCSDVNGEIDGNRDVGAYYCTQLDGCTYSGVLGTCGGSITKTCADLGNNDYCSEYGCERERFGECKGSTGCSNYNNKESECYSHAGCYFEQAFTCVAPRDCSWYWDSSCTAAIGCSWDEDKEECTGVLTLTNATCNAITGSGDCYSAGCRTKERFNCVGEHLNISSCTKVPIADERCSVLGCSITPGSAGTCSGEINFNAGAGVTSEEGCYEKGYFMYWDDGQAYCDYKDPEISQPPKPCSEFTTNGKDVCIGLGCTWDVGVPIGCSGTPINAGTDCASLVDESTCSGNQCTWVASGDKSCTGTSTGSCDGRTEASCKSTGGCTYTPAVDSSSCTGTPTKSCIGGSPSSCENVNGCIWSSGCSSLSTKTQCEGAGSCVWNECSEGSEGEEEEEEEAEGSEGNNSPGNNSPGSAASFYAPALLVLLLLTLLF